MRTKNIAGATLFAACVALSLIGCGKSGLSGKWNMTGGGMPPGATSQIEFTGDKYTMEVSASQGAMALKVNTAGTFTYKDTKLEMTQTSMTIDDSKLPAQVRDMVKKQIETTMPKTQSGTVTMTDADNATLATEKGSITLTRVKA